MKNYNEIQPYSDIKINTNEIEQSLLDIDNKVRTNLFSWNGQFSPQFIEVLLAKYANKNDIIYDPFSGSGTTLCECARKNITSYGTELNPSAYYMAKSYEICNLCLEQRNDIMEKINEKVNNIISVDAILSTLTTEIEQNENKYIKNTLSLLIIIMDIYKNELSIELLNNKWNKLKGIIFEMPYCSNNINVSMGDARNTALLDNTVDIVITSPPYINVFNYHQKYRRSVEALGYNVLNIAKKEFGSNRKNRGNRFLTVVQYCIDMALTMRELIRVGKDKSRFILVVGRESNILKLSFCNSELIYNIGCKIFGLKLLIKQQRVFKNRYGIMIYEDILHFENNKLNYELLSEEDIINMAREIAKSFLQEKVGQVNNDYKDYNLLINSIENVYKVEKSEDDNE
jgi:16S rRNA G966 N2-methylase RsmD